MRSLLALLFLAPVAVAQTSEEKKATLAFIDSLRDTDTGAFEDTPDGKPSLRACNAAVKAIKVLGGELADRDKVSKFVLSCYDGKAGTFADPGAKADVASTAIGVIVACELGIPKDKFQGAMDYLGTNAREFEDARIAAAAAVEAWGVKGCPFELDRWREALAVVSQGRRDARLVGSATALHLRIGGTLPAESRGTVVELVTSDQKADGGWGKADAKASDVETTYRVMRALVLLNGPPNDGKKLRAFLAAHRNKDGGYATERGKASSMSGVYYNAVVSKWLDDLGKK